MKSFSRLAIATILGLSLTLASCRRVEPPVINPSSGPSIDTSGSSDPSDNPEGTTLPGTDDTANETTPETTSAETTRGETTETGSESTDPNQTDQTDPTDPTGPSEPTDLSEPTDPNQTDPNQTDPNHPSSPTTSSRTTSASTTRDPLGGIIDEWLNPTTPNAKPGSIRNPLKPGETAHFDGYDTLFDPFQADVIVQQIYRGTEALQMVKDASSVNPDPDDGYEYLVAQVLVKITDSKNGETVGVSPYFFSLAREDGRMYGDVSLFRAITPVLSTLRVGETSIGYICFQVDQNDPNPFIVFLSRAHGGIWFSTEDPEAAPAGTTRFSIK